MQEDGRTGKIMEYGIEEKLLIAPSPYAFPLIRWVKIELVTAI
jgi:hypothetical protein